MADDQSLTVTINANTDGATDGMSRVAAALDQIVAKMGAASSSGASSGSTIADAHRLAGDAARTHAEAETILGDSIGKVESATNSAARLFSTLGLQTGEATERVEALGEAMDGLGKAAVPLLAIGAAVLTAAAAFNFLKDGIDEAAKQQAALAALGQAVENQGGSWSAAREGVDRFLDAIEHATTYSRGEATEALNTLVTAGMSLAGAEHAVAIATDVAAGSHRSLIEVVDLIKEAEAGRGRGLVELDGHLKGVIENHGNLSTALTILANDFQNQAATAAETYQGKIVVLKDELGHLGEELGEHLIPLLSAGTEVFIGWAEDAEQALPSVARFFDTVTREAKAATETIDDLVNVAKTVGEVFAGIRDPGQDKRTSASVQDLLTPTGFGSDPAKSDGGTFMRMLSQGREEYEKVQKSAQEALEQFRKNALPTGDDATLGGKAAGAKQGKDFDFEPTDAPTFDKDDDTAAEKRLDEQLKAITESEAGYERAVKDATNAVDEHNAKLALWTKQSQDAQAEVNLIALALDGEQKKLSALNAELPAQKQAWIDTTEAYNAYGVAIGKNPSKDQENHLKDLKKAMDDAKGAYDSTSTSIEKLTGIIDQNNAKLVEAAAKTNALKDAQAELDRQNEASIDAFLKKIADENAATKKAQDAEDARRQTQIADLATENALYGESLQQQLNFYRERFANAVAAGQQYSDQAKSDWAKIISLEGDVYKERLDAQKQFIENAQSLESDFLNTVLTKHQSLRESLKQIFTDIEGDFVKMLEQMIVKSSILNGLNAQLEKIFNVGGGGQFNAAGGVGGGTGGAALFGGPASGSSLANSSLVTGIDSPGSNAIVDLGSNSLLGLTGSPTGVITGAAAPQANFTTPGGAAGVIVDRGTGSSSPGVGAYLGSAAVGAGYGQLVAGLDGGNSTYASIGGALGGIASVVTAANPLAGLGLQIGGSLLGSLLSGNQPTAAKDPDEFEGTTGYGQDVADLQFGPAGASGVSYYPSAAIAKFVAAENVGAGTITGGANMGTQTRNSNGTIASAGGVDAAEIWLNANKGDTAAQLEAMGVSPSQFSQWVSLFGESATGSGAYTHYDKNVGDIEITGAQTGGNTKTTTSALAAALNSIITASGNSSSETSPVFTVGRTYPNMNLGTLSQTGTYNETTSGVNVPTSQTTTPSAKAGTVTTSPVSTDGMTDDPISKAGGVVIHINNPTFLTSSDMRKTTDALAQSMAISLQKYASGQLAGGLAARTRARSGNY